MLTGCLPSSCQFQQSRALFPSDSLSRQIAEQTPVDTLRLVWKADLSEAGGLENPRTVLFGPDGRLYVSDTEQNKVHAYGEGGTSLGDIGSDGLEHPYLVGFRGDTLLIFNAGANRIDFVVEGRRGRSLNLPSDLRDQEAFQYVAASDSTLYLKSVAEEKPGYIARLDDQGQIIRREPLTGPYWRYAGALRLWGDSLISLSGYRPVVDVLTPGAPLDSLALSGFDSPMLARSRLFMLGHVDEAPLLTSSAAPVGGHLFVLNVRPGWLRVDVYDRSGQLRRVLVQENPGFDRSFYPMDLAVREVSPGTYDIAVISAGDPPQVFVYRWHAG